MAVTDADSDVHSIVSFHFVSVDIIDLFTHLGMLMSLFLGRRESLWKATLIPMATAMVKEMTPPMT